VRRGRPDCANGSGITRGYATAARIRIRPRRQRVLPLRRDTLSCMSDGNGVANPVPDVVVRLREARAKVKLARAENELARMTRHTRRLTESNLLWDWTSGYSDLLDRLRTDDGKLLLAPSTVTDRLYGGNFPWWRTWQEHALLRAQSRMLCGMSDLASGALNALSSYVVASGYKHRAAAKKHQNAPPSLVDAVQEIIDLTAAKNLLGTLEGELFRRDRRDGEFFVRDFADSGGNDDEDHDGVAVIRIVEPEQVMDPPNNRLAETSFGCFNREGDIQSIYAYWVCYGGLQVQGEEVSSRELIHHRSENVDRTIKRGLPDFVYDTYEALKSAGRTVGNMLESAGIQASVAEIRQHEIATPDQVQTFVDSESDFQTADSWTGQKVNNRRSMPGEVRDIPKGMTYVPPPFSNGAPAWIQIVQAGLRRAGVRWNAPEWLISADASNGNYASSLVAESPFRKRCEAWQADYRTPFNLLVVRAVRRAADAGRIRAEGKTWTWREIKRLVDITSDPPALEARNLLSEAQTNQIRLQAGVFSPQLWCAADGVDYEQVQADLEEHQERTGERGGVPGMGMPGEGGPGGGAGEGGAGEGGPGGGGEGPDAGPGSGDDRGLAGLLGEAIRRAIVPAVSAPLLESDQGDQGQADHAGETATWYAQICTLLAAAGDDPGDMASEAASELDGTGWDVQEVGGKWVATHDGSPVDVQEGEQKTDKRGRKYCYDAARKVRVKCDTAQAKADVDTRAARGNVDHAALSARLEKHAAAHKVEGLDKRRASAAATMLHRHHGELALHRVEELADRLEGALKKVPKDQAGLRDNIGQQLARLQHAAEAIKAKGVTGEVAGGGKAKEKPAAHERKPVAPDTTKIEADIFAAHKALTTRQNPQGPLIPEIYDAIKAKHPDLTREQFHDALRKMQADDKLTMQVHQSEGPQLQRMTGHPPESFPNHQRGGKAAWISPRETVAEPPPKSAPDDLDSDEGPSKEEVAGHRKQLADLKGKPDKASMAKKLESLYGLAGSYNSSREELRDGLDDTLNSASKEDLLAVARDLDRPVRASTTRAQIIDMLRRRVLERKEALEGGLT
jgi:hypothetical protein